MMMLLSFWLATVLVAGASHEAWDGIDTHTSFPRSMNSGSYCVSGVSKSQVGHC